MGGGGGGGGHGQGVHTRGWAPVWGSGRFQENYIRGRSACAFRTVRHPNTNPCVCEAVCLCRGAGFAVPLRSLQPALFLSTQECAPMSSLDTLAPCIPSTTPPAVRPSCLGVGIKLLESGILRTVCVGRSTGDGLNPHLDEDESCPWVPWSPGSHPRLVFGSGAGCFFFASKFASVWLCLQFSFTCLWFPWCGLHPLSLCCSCRPCHLLCVL